MMRRAFTLLELTFVIAILGIVASIASEIIARIYDQYIIQRAYYKASLKTELAALEIANRLSHAIPGTVYRIRNNGNYEAITTPLIGNGDDYKGIQWVGEDIEGFNYTGANPPNDHNPTWSGFCDLDQATKTSVPTPGSNLQRLGTIIGYLSRHQGNAGRGAAVGSYLYFPTENDPNIANNITSVNNAQNRLSMQNVGTTRHISERYKLAWSSYALVVENGDLRLYYDMTPQNPNALGANAYQSNSTSSLLLANVATFKFTGTENAIRFKICINEPVGNDLNVTACKEKVVF